MFVTRLHTQTEKISRAKRTRQCVYSSKMKHVIGLVNVCMFFFNTYTVAAESYYLAYGIVKFITM